MNLFNGILHVHSKYSYDGKYNLQELVHLFKLLGFNFIGLNEHSESIDKKKMIKLVSKCKKLSDKNFLLIPGLEINCNNGQEILALGINEFINENNIYEVIEKIHELGGLAIFPHPIKNKIKYQNFFKDLDGIEVWNFEYDGIFPNFNSLKLLKKLRGLNKNLFGYCGVDFHRFFHYFWVKNISIQIKVESLSLNKILSEFSAGKFYFKNQFMCMNSRGDFGFFKKLLFGSSNLIYKNVRSKTISLLNTLRKF